MKNKIIAGNWKMNKTMADTKALIAELAPLVADTNNTVVLCVPYTDLATAIDSAKDTNINIGAQNCHWAKSGAFTGEISADMLVELGVKYVVLGHSERRTYFGETDATVLARTTACLNAGLTPIVCIGETLDERNTGKMAEVLNRQIREGFAAITAEQMSNVVVAYEPIWAIGTGVTATDQEANDSIALCRDIFADMYGQEVADALYIQYGGSMNDANAEALLSMPHIDGGLIGGASLVATKFAVIVNAK